MPESGQWSDYFITKAGRAFRQKCIAEGKTPVFTRAAIGSGKPAFISGIDNLTSLVSYETDVILKKSYAHEDNHLCIVRIDNAGYTQPILMTEVAVFAKCEDVPELLYGYTFNMDGYVLIPAQTSVTNRKVYEMTLDTCLSRSSEIQIVYDDASLWISHEDFNDFISSWIPTEYLATVTHEFDYDPVLMLERSRAGIGTMPFGHGAFGGAPTPSVPVRYERHSGRRISVYTLPEFKGAHQMIRHSKYQYAFRFPDGRDSLILKLR